MLMAFFIDFFQAGSGWLRDQTSPAAHARSDFYISLGTSLSVSQRFRRSAVDFSNLRYHQN